MLYCKRAAKLFLVLPLLGFLYGKTAFSEGGESSASMEGRIGNDTVYFLNPQKVMHHSYHLMVKQKAKINEKISTNLSGRFFFDAALAGLDDHPFVYRHDVDERVRIDEKSESSLREASVDFTFPIGHVRIGRQLVDWIDSITPYASDILTPIDFRQGGFGPADQVIRPLDAMLVSVTVPGGSLEGIAVAHPLGHQLPKGPNGYGFYEPLEQRFADNRDLRIKDDGIPQTRSQTEAGGRYVGYWGGTDVMFLAFHGHMRTPLIQAANTSDDFDLKTNYPMLNTYGASASWSWNAVVFRMLSFYEPNRQLQSYRGRLISTHDAAELMAKRYRHGLGFDFVLNEHFKLYSETWANQVISSDEARNLDPSIEHVRTDYTISSRITNESISKFLLTIESVISTPKHSSIFSPSATLTIGDSAKLTAGWRMISSDNPGAPYEALKDADQAYGSLDWYF